MDDVERVKQRFRVVARDPTSDQQTVIIEEFWDETDAAAKVARRGWSQIERITPATADEESEPGADVAEPFQPTVLRREGPWVYLDEASAERHPLYGVHGWAALLLLGLTAGPVLNTIFDLTRTPYSRQIDPITIAIDIFLIGYCWFIAWLLVKHSAAFRTHYFILAGLGFAVSLLILATGDSGAAPIALRNIIGTTIWLLYVFLSKRINATTLKRVKTTDPFVAQAVVKFSNTQESWNRFWKAPPSATSSDQPAPRTVEAEPQADKTKLESTESHANLSSGNVADRLRDLTAAYREGLITETEFQLIKSRLLDQF
jgi:hypothetical protein